MTMVHRFQFRRNILIAAFITVGLLYFFCTVYAKQFFLQTKEIECYRIKGESLPNILDESPAKDKSIFFHETSCSSFYNGKIGITARQACAVESAAITNPNFEVYLLFTSPGVIKNEGSESDRILKALASYKNIKMHHLDYEKYTKDTPLEKLYSSGKIESSKYSTSHASDVLRYLTLWRYGGIYLDLDVIVIKSLEKVPPNYAGAESVNNVAAGILSFASEGVGHNLSQKCVEDLRDNFNGNDWGYNGPGVITRLLQKLCKAKRAKEMVHKDCHGFKVYPVEAFYAVPWTNWYKYFNSKYNNEVLKLSRNSYIVHVWNKHSVNTKINVTTDVPYSIFAKKFCPKVFAECYEFF